MRPSFRLIVLALVAFLALGPALAQADDSDEERSALFTLLSWIPLLLLLGLWGVFTLWMMRKGKLGTHGRVAEQAGPHMDAVEKKLDRIIELLEQRSR